ncbi:hypothetical protein [Gracilibacillus salinarum]|uniref:RiboL-PSP-HEPN domain-containing protein n=1 Tax=Gracilibacillus salinarum TaxID=2932255 RepID=A0ABY4GNB7_9BACI|nr:hypothetical protein [Gracilibacillus salinarum]UOQ85681.1 hypothetical protein MUN87_01880 [Gracilibacillus salinarum]
MNYKEKVNNLLIDADIKLIEKYKAVALLVNSSVVAQERYINSEHITALSLIGGIPNHYRFNIEMDHQLGRERLINEYQTSIPKNIAEFYLITIVSSFDILLQEIYKILLEERELYDREIVEEKVSSAWYYKNLPDYFQRELKLKKPSKSKFKFQDYFNTYNILRQMRHSLVHTDGKLSDKQYYNIDKIEKKIPEEASVLNSHLIDGREIIFDMETIAWLRFWSHSFISTLIVSFEETLS